MSSKKQLMAEIEMAEKVLYSEQQRIVKSKQQISKHKTSYILGALMLTSIPIIFLCRSKENVRKLANSAVSVGRFALVTYCKKIITNLLEKKEQ